ncbi:MAG TPA: glutamine synthetase, partial [Candidatus Cloacimonadota bacterium]|nr:glutamine synthetase [Candidatus Cloacimonadota bacterium]
MDLKTLQQLIDKNEIQAIDLKYCGLDGKWYHITFPSRRIENVLQRGIPFDGSSIPGMRSVESGDMVLMPDIETAQIDPFYEVPTLRMI